MAEELQKDSVTNQRVAAIQTEDNKVRFDQQDSPSTESSTLLITIANDLSSEESSLSIDKIRIEKSENLKELGSNAKEIFETLAKPNVQTRVIQKEILDVNINGKSIKLQNSSSALRSQSENDAPQNKKQIDFKELINHQQQQYEELKYKFDEEITKREAEITNLKKENEYRQIQSQQVKRQGEETATQLQKIKNMLTQIYEQRKEFQLFQHPYNPHSFHFNTHLTPNSLRITKATDNIYHNFISNLPIPFNTITKFRIKQVKITDGYLYQGVGTKSVFGDSNCWNKDYISYYSGDGDICVESTYQEGGEPIDNGQIMTIQIDLVTYRVIWMLDETKVAEAAIPEHMRGQKLYLVLVMKHRGDELELLFD